MTPSADGPILTLSRRNLAWLFAAGVALAGGSQTAIQFAGADQDPRVDELSAKFDQLGADMQRMREESIAREQRYNRLLSAVVVFLIESDRFDRENQSSKKPRSQELDAAAARLRQLASQD